MKDTEAIIESDALRTKLDEVLASMGNSSTIETSDIKFSFKSQIAAELQNLDYLSDQISLSRWDDANDAKNGVKQRASNIENDAHDRAAQLIDAVRGQYKEALRKAKEESISVFRERKDEFISKVEAAIADHVEKLESDIRNKGVELEKYKKSLNVLERIGGLL